MVHTLLKSGLTNLTLLLRRKFQPHCTVWNKENFLESVGEGVFEYKIHFGPGYRIYFGQVGQELVILVGGGSKKQQSHDIKKAKELWVEYKIENRRE
jgi:hypothetical protein